MVAHFCEHCTVPAASSCGTWNSLCFGVPVRYSWCSAHSFLLHFSQAPSLCKQRCQFITMHFSASGLSRGAGEVNCLITCPRAQFFAGRAVPLCKLLLLLLTYSCTLHFVLLCSALCPSQKPPPPRQPWEPFWYFSKLIELRIERVWHMFS